MGLSGNSCREFFSLLIAFPCCIFCVYSAQAHNSGGQCSEQPS